MIAPCPAQREERTSLGSVASALKESKKTLALTKQYSSSQASALLTAVASPETLSAPSSKGGEDVDPPDETGVETHSSGASRPSSRPGTGSMAVGERQVGAQMPAVAPTPAKLEDEASESGDDDWEAMIADVIGPDEEAYGFSTLRQMPQLPNSYASDEDWTDDHGEGSSAAGTPLYADTEDAESANTFKVRSI